MLHHSKNNVKFVKGNLYIVDRKTVSFHDFNTEILGDILIADNTESL